MAHHTTLSRERVYNTDGDGFSHFSRKIAFPLTEAHSLCLVGFSALQFALERNRPIMSHPSEVPINTMTSHVHWNDDTGNITERLESVRLDRSIHNDTDACNADTSSKGRQRDDLRTKINKAVQIELAYLDKAIEIGKKRKMMVRILRSAAEDNHEHQTTEEIVSYPSKQQKITEKIAYATKLEKAYFHKARQVHDRRYRWTKLFELSQNKNDSKADHLQSTCKLPPLMTSFYSTEEKLSTT